MEVKDLVRVNQDGIIANAVNFEMLADPTKNSELCKGFIFSFDRSQETRKKTTIGVVEAVIEGFKSPNKPKIHLMVQDYGRGKSHFALVMANFFAKPLDHPDVINILSQIANASGHDASSVREYLIDYKKQNPRHLVIPLTGGRGDLRRLLLQKLRETLEAEGITDTVAHHICDAPLQFLKKLNTEQQNRANNYIQNHYAELGNIQTLIHRLKRQDYNAISIVKEMSQEVMGFGVAFDFDTGLDVVTILNELIDKLCQGTNKRFSGILILLDELNQYLQDWSYNKAAAGGLTLQNITDLCEDNKSRISLISFTQIRPSTATAQALNANEVKVYQQLATRLEVPESVYEVESKLEHVVDRLLLQESYPEAWAEFGHKCIGSLFDETTALFERYTVWYKENGWQRDEIYRVITYGCYPLHPITTFLLCHLDFTQGRTAIQFLKKEVNDFIQNQTQAINDEGKPNLIFPYVLVSAFNSNFSSYPIHTDYLKARQSIASSAEGNDLCVLEALFLYFASSDKLKKLDTEGHEKILSRLTGLSENIVKISLEKLRKHYGVLFETESTKTYHFYLKYSINDLQAEIAEAAKKKHATIEGIVSFCNQSIERYLNNKNVPGSDFIEDKRLNPETWQFANLVCTFRDFLGLIKPQGQIITDGQQRGTILYILTATDDEARQVRESIGDYLVNSKHNAYLIIGLPEKGLEDLPHIYLRYSILITLTSTERDKYGQAYTEFEKDLRETLEKRLKDLFLKSQLYYVEHNRISSQPRHFEKKLVSKLLGARYSLVPPIGSDKIKSNSSGGQIISYACRNLLTSGELALSLPNQSYETVYDQTFSERWRLLNKTSTRYLVQEPENPIVRQAWDKIDELTALFGQSERTISTQIIWEVLSSPPYGYDELTFSMLFVSWTVKHQRELVFSGNERITKRNEKSTFLKRQQLREWVLLKSNIFDKPSDFITWLTKNDTELIRRKALTRPQIVAPMSLIQAHTYLADLELFIAQPNAELHERDASQNDRNRIQRSFDEINKWRQEIEKFKEEIQVASIEKLLSDLYPNHKKIAFPELSKESLYQIIPDEHMIGLQKHSYEKLLERIHEEIEKVCRRAKKTSSESALEICENETKKILKFLRQTSGLPSVLTENLKAALEKGRLRLEQTKEQERISEIIKQVQNFYSKLGINPSQDHLQIISSEMEEYARQLPNLNNDPDFISLLNKITDQQKQLINNLNNFETRINQLTSFQEASLLGKEISLQIPRYTEESSKHRIQTLNESLQSKLHQFQQLQTAATIAQTRIEQLRRDLRNLIQSQDFKQVFEGYQEIQKATIPEEFQSLPNAIQLRKEWITIQEKSQKEVEKKLSKLVEQTIIRLDEYDRVRNQIEQVRKALVANDVFPQFIEKFTKQLKSLKQRQKDLLEQDEDEKVMRDLRNVQYEQTCIGHEIALHQIDKFVSNLHHLQPYTTEIESKRLTLRQRLDEKKTRLVTIQDKLRMVDEKTLTALRKDITTLEDWFEGSSYSEECASIQTKLEEMEGDFGRINRLPTLKAQSATLAECEKALIQIAEARNSLSDPNRFAKRINELEDEVQNLHNSLIRDLNAKQTEIQTLKLEQVRSFRDALTKIEWKYKESKAESTYNTIFKQADRLFDFVRLRIDLMKTESIATCEGNKRQLVQWLESHPDLPDFIQQHVEHDLKYIDAQIERVRQHKKTKALQWISDLQTRHTAAQSQANELDQAESAMKILDTIEKSSETYQEFLKDDSFSNRLVPIEDWCRSAVSRSHETQIRTLFQKLSFGKQAELLKQLEYIMHKEQSAQTS